MILLIDLNNLVHTAWHASHGTRAVAMTRGWIESALETFRPTHAAAAVDRPWPTWRDDLSAKYKRERKEDPERMAARAAIVADLRAVEELIEDLWGMRTFGMKGFEGDDIIATLCARARAEGLDVAILTRDKDLLQLVTPIAPLVRVVDYPTMNEVGAREVEGRYGIRAEQFVEWLALVGDSTDGYPGCPGVGPRAAEDLLGAFDTARDALEAARAGSGFYAGKAGLARKLLAGAEDLELSRRLAGLCGTVELEVAVGELSVAIDA